VWAALVVLLPPRLDFVARIGQVLEPVGVQTFVPKSAVEAFDKAVLHWLAGLNEHQRDIPLFRPCDEASARELRTIVEAETVWPALVAR
jgi:hypothetical protein